MVKLAGHVAHMGEMGNAYGLLVGRHVRKLVLGRPKSTWENNIKRDLKELVYESVKWINLAEERDKRLSLVDVILDLWLPSKERIFWPAY